MIYYPEPEKIINMEVGRCLGTVRKDYFEAYTDARKKLRRKEYLYVLISQKVVFVNLQEYKNIHGSAQKFYALSKQEHAKSK